MSDSQTADLRSLLEWAHGRLLGFYALNQPDAYEQDMMAAIENAIEAPDETNGCTRSHPHEEMSEACVLRTEIARLQNHLAQKSAQITRLQDGIERMQQGAPETTAAICGDSINLNGVDWVCRKPADHRDHERQPCEHLRSELLAEKRTEGRPLFEMRKCLDCTKIFRVRLSVKAGG